MNVIQRAIATAILLIGQYCQAQDNNFLQFRILSRGNGLPIMAASLRIEDSIAYRFYQDFSDSNGIIRFNLSWLKSDSAFLSVRVATDTLTVFKIYKKRKYDYEINLYVDTEAIRKRNSIVGGKRYKRKKQ